MDSGKVSALFLLYFTGAALVLIVVTTCKKRDSRAAVAAIVVPANASCVVTARIGFSTISQSKRTPTVTQIILSVQFGDVYVEGVADC